MLGGRDKRRGKLNGSRLEIIAINDGREKMSPCLAEKKTTLCRGARRESEVSQD